MAALMTRMCRTPDEVSRTILDDDIQREPRPHHRGAYSPAGCQSGGRIGNGIVPSSV